MTRAVHILPLKFSVHYILGHPFIDRAAEGTVWLLYAHSDNF